MKPGCRDLRRRGCCHDLAAARLLPRHRRAAHRHGRPRVRRGAAATGNMMPETAMVISSPGLPGGHRERMPEEIREYVFSTMQYVTLKKNIFPPR
jgi:hypothetical protein